MAYATPEDLAQALHVKVTAENSASLVWCVEAAVEEIDHFCNRRAGSPIPVDDPLAHMVNVGRGVEHYKAGDAAFGALGFDGTGVLTAPERHVRKVGTSPHPTQAPIRRSVTEAFQVTRALTGTSGAATDASALTLDVGGTLSLTGTSGAASYASAVLSVFGQGRTAGPLALFRLRVAAVLDAIDDAWTVYPSVVDALTPPAYLLEWADPWTAPATACHAYASLVVVCVAARVEPDPGVETLEFMVGDALAALTAAGIAYGESSPPRPFPVGGVTYLAARFPVRNTVNLGG